ncbi:MAG TPA: hypothetical protein VKK31_30580 [Thermoanaerobaculia bacterium]|nr:hypothetical protein [Thermoanaerobaculia bacterium]
MDSITIVNQASEPVRVAIFRRPPSNGGVAVAWRIAEVPPRGRTRLAGESYGISLAAQLPAGLERGEVVELAGPPARFEIRPNPLPEPPILILTSADAGDDEVQVGNGADVPVQVFLYRESQEIGRSPFLERGEEFSFHVRSELYAALVESVQPGDEMPPELAGQAVRIYSGQTATVTEAAGGGLGIEVG